MDLSVDVSGFIASDLNTEHGLVGCLTVDPHRSDPHSSDPHCSDPTSSLPQTRFPLLASARPGMGGSIQPIHLSSQSDNSGPTGQPVQSTRTGRTSGTWAARLSVNFVRTPGSDDSLQRHGAPGKAPRKAKGGGIRKSLRLLFKNRKIRPLGFETRAVGRQVLAWCPSCRCGSFLSEMIWLNDLDSRWVALPCRVEKGPFVSNWSLLLAQSVLTDRMAQLADKSECQAIPQNLF
jgi:hypothetical protein